MSIEIRNLNYIYMKGTPFEKKALDDVNFSILDGEFIGLIGSTGSGKSTLVQHMNGLLKPDSGSIFIDGEDIYSKKIKLSDIRKKVGLIFQYPEYQLFEETVEKDVAYGPKNLGLSDDEIKKRVMKAMELVGLSY
ncbi:MAG: ATP-binding cassette domain-containing protein, partial [Oscillospiraceae bacterium]|nr:ATP-binding cassette domain-containing protein [Oscillospiraceae bacterium]